ncbi:GNAT family N-acetyltransferase [Catenulispora rubra]|uniref:GNAT family N-acetyltransferase n=1 Tax=Catenulispora rubra TaxID=280293 RepID=UPI002B275AC0|nr:GNAT family N-acetyltransferase [Catenulispora rubra]
MTPVITRVAADQWHAIDDGLTVGRGNTSRRPDGRLFVSVDAWHDAVFDQLAAVMLAELPAPLYTVLDAEESAMAENWRRAGFVERRRERHYLVSLETRITARPPAGVTLVGGEDVFRAEVEGTESAGAEVGLIRLTPLMRSDGTPRIARIASIEVRADQRRRGIGRALLAHGLDALRERGFRMASVDVDETDTAAIVLVEGAGARRTSNSLELMWEN